VWLLGKHRWCHGKSQDVFLLLKDCGEKPLGRDAGNQSPNLTWSEMRVAEG